MTPEQLLLIQQTTAEVERDASRFSARFYERLFELEPDLRPLFPDDLTAPRGKLVDELLFLAGAAVDLPVFLERARHLGARHQSYGVRPDHYDTVRAALMDSLSEVLGSRWDEVTGRAWRSLYCLVAETMLEGARGSLFTATS
jgi:nitric oxide dioxygenase